MRARYAWTRSFEVQRPFFIPSWSSAIVISSNLKAPALGTLVGAGFAVADGFGAVAGAAVAGGAAVAARSVPMMRQRDAMRAVFMLIMRMMSSFGWGTLVRRNVSRPSLRASSVSAADAGSGHRRANSIRL